MKDNIDKIFDDFLSKQTIKAPADFYENLMDNINSQDEIIEENFDSFLNKKISSNLSFDSDLIKAKRKFVFSKLTKYVACVATVCVIATSAFIFKGTSTNANMSKSDDIDLYAEFMFFSNEGVADISEVSSQNALDMLNYFASTSL